MQIRVIRATASLLALFILSANASNAQDTFRIERPTRSQAPAVQVPAAQSPASQVSAPQSQSPEIVTGQSAPVSSLSQSSDCQNPCCSLNAPSFVLSSPLPSEGLYARWRAEFINPTTCPVRLCHGSCKRSSVSCRSIKTKIDSLLDAYIPEEVPVEALLNFRCCAGFTED